MGPMELPFTSGVSTPIQILQITDTGNNQTTDIYVAIVFSRTTGNDVVTLRMTDASGNPVLLIADQRKLESAKSVVVPMRYLGPVDDQRNGVWLMSTSSSAQGSILISTAP